MEVSRRGIRGGAYATFLLVASLVACENGPRVPRPATVTAHLVSPNGAEGAALLVLRGEGLDSAMVTGVGPTEAFGRPDSASIRVLLVNQAGGTLSFEIALPDVDRLPTWVVEEVAGPDDALRGSLAAYVVEFVR